MGTPTDASETSRITAGVGAGASGKRGDSEQGARKSQRPDIAKDTGGVGRGSGVPGERVSQIRRMTYRTNESNVEIYIGKERIRDWDLHNCRMNHRQ